MVHRSRRLVTAVFFIPTLVLVAIPSKLNADIDMIDAPEMLPPSHLRTISVETPGGLQELTLEHFQHAGMPDTVRVMGDVYLWWLSRSADSELVHAYALLPHVNVSAFNIFGQPLEISDYEVTARTDAGSGHYGFEFDVSVDGPTPIILVFEADGWIHSATYSGERINDTFVPTISWIAGLSTTEPTVLNIAIPTVGQLFAAGGQEAVDAQLDLLRSVLGDNERAKVIWEEASERASKAKSEYEVQAERWTITSSCEECPVMVAVPSMTLIIGENSVQIEDFSSGKYAVTRREFSRFVGRTKYEMGDCYSVSDTLTLIRNGGNDWRNPGYEQYDDDPVTCVSLDDAQAYVEWLSSSSGSPYRLLSYSEWVYAAHETSKDPKKTNVIGIVSDDMRELIDDGRRVKFDPSAQTPTAFSQSVPRDIGLVMTGFRVARTIAR